MYYIQTVEEHSDIRPFAVDAAEPVISATVPDLYERSLFQEWLEGFGFWVIALIVYHSL